MSWFSPFIFATGLICTAVSVNAKQQDEPLPLDELRAFTEAYYYIKSAYVQPVDDVTLLRAAIRGMVAELDRHSRYLSPEEFQRFNDDTEGEYAGLGLSLSDHELGLQIEEVMSNSPAEAAGLKAGMIVIEIDGKSLKFVPKEEAYHLLEGEVGAEVKLTITHQQLAQPKVFPLTRQRILLESIDSELLPNQTGYISISQFTLHSVEEFQRAVKAMSAKQKLKNLIIDLRDNPGGVMEIAVELSDLFISEGKLLISSGRTDDSNEIYYAKKEAPFAQLNLVVMINQGSASASEILAAALQDHHKALIFGEESYGKGSIQSVYSLSKNAGLKLTTAEYFSPDGHRIQEVGITPDIKYIQQERPNPYNVTRLDDPQLLQAYDLVVGKVSK